MEWAMLYLFVALKIPLVALFWLIWWAVKQEPDTEDSGGDGGQRTPARPHPHPHPRLPHAPRRGPHADPLPLPPPRVRPARARARQLER